MEDADVCCVSFLLTLLMRFVNQDGNVLNRVTGSDSQFIFVLHFIHNNFFKCGIWFAMLSLFVSACSSTG